MMRDVLRRACREQFRLEVVAECDRAESARKAVAAHKPDLAILDLQLPDGDGLPLLAELQALHPTLKILVLSSRCDAFTVYRLEKAEVAGFVDKGSQTVDMLGEALKALIAGTRYFSPEYHRSRRRRLEDPRSFDKLLSDREQSVLACLGDCLSDDEVAAELGITAATAAKHRFNVMHKLSVKTTLAAMRYAQAAGFCRSRLPSRKSQTRN